VKGSQDGSWGLTQGYLTKGQADYHGAVDRWLAKHGLKTIFCLVQFQGVELTGMPRVYLAAPSEIATRLKATSNNKGDTILYEAKTWTARAKAAGTTEKVPDAWLFSRERVETLFNRPEVLV
jgi:hypothetical protein